MALLPIKDDNPLNRIQFQYVTVALIAVCIAVFLWEVSLGDQRGRAIFGFGHIPAVLFGTRTLPPELEQIPAWLTLVTSMFLHGGWLHLGFNMLFLWVFGDNVEDALGHLRYLVFYVLCGVIGTLLHALAAPESTVPLVGASGAISGVLGAYLVLHPKARLLVLFMNIIPLRLPAVLVLLFWIGSQFFSLSQSGVGADTGGTAWLAHIGGFIAGMILVVPFRRKSVPLFDGIGRFAPVPELELVIDEEENRHRRSIFPNTYLPEPERPRSRRSVIPDSDAKF